VTIICLAFYFIFHGKIGAGDIKLFWVISFWTPTFIQWLEGLTMSWLLGGLFAIAYATFNRLKGKLIPSIPFAPFIFAGFLPVI
jgi:Flp pilus assembly protein protease CpaA